MNRREALQRTGLVLGYAVSAPVLAGILNGCKAQPELPFKPVFLNDNQARLVSELAEIIIPKTDTPGAKDAGVPGFIDKVLNECYKKTDQQRYLDGLKAFEEEAEKVMGDSVLDLAPSKQVEFATAGVEDKRNTGEWTADEEKKLEKLVEKFGKDWISVEKGIKTRTRHQCRIKW